MKFRKESEIRAIEKKEGKVGKEGGVELMVRRCN